jgi:hypothetical protein
MSDQNFEEPGDSGVPRRTPRLGLTAATTRTRLASRQRGFPFRGLDDNADTSHDADAAAAYDGSGGA